MKRFGILDRYILGTFLKNYFISLFVLIGMYIVLDLVMSFDELFDFSQTGAAAASGLDNAIRVLRNIADFYVYQIPLIYVHLAPMIPIVAAAFTLLRMMRFNETIATLAAGVPLLRIAAPIILCTCVLTVALWPLQEALIPSIIPKLLRDHEDIGRESRRSFQVKALEDPDGNLLVAARFNPPTENSPATMIEVDLVLRDQDKLPRGHVLAEKAIYDAKAHLWRLTGGQQIIGLFPGQRREQLSNISVLPSRLTPDEIILYRSRDYVELLPTARINQLLSAPRNYGVTDLLRVKHFRFSQYFNNLILVLLTVSCVVTREPRSLRTGGAFLLGITGLYLGFIFLAQHLAGSQALVSSLAPHWPALMAFFPVLLFGPLAVYALDRIKT